MWIGKDVFNTMNSLIESSQNCNTDMLRREGELRQQVKDLDTALTQARSDIQWFMHRLNQVEMERAQLIYAATGGSGRAAEGVKIAAPQFMTGPPVGTVSETLNNQYNPFGTTGEDSADPQDQIPEDLTHMPRFKG